MQLFIIQQCKKHFCWYQCGYFFWKNVNVCKIMNNMVYLFCSHQCHAVHPLTRPAAIMHDCYKHSSKKWLLCIDNCHYFQKMNVGWCRQNWLVGIMIIGSITYSNFFGNGGVASIWLILALSSMCNKRLFVDKNHTRTIYHFLCTLGFVLILEETTRGIKNGPWTPTMTDHSFTSHFTMTSFHQVWCYNHQWQLIPSTKLSHIIPQGPHHQPTRDLLWEVSSGISAEIHRKLIKIWASRLAFLEPTKLVSLFTFSWTNSQVSQY